MSERTWFDLIPTEARFLAVLVFLGFAALLSWIFDDHHPLGLGTLLGLGLGTIAGAFVLLAGYVYGDASRRGMPPIAWTALALLIPNGVGFVLYFLLRKPMLHPCPNCHSGVAPEAGFCPRCGQPQSNEGVQPSWKQS